jgi:DNA repair protein RecO (recombination protein O)
MLQKTQGIVISYIKYKETSIICKIYTEEYGLYSFIINGVRKEKNKSAQAISLFQPLSILDMVIYYNPKSTLQRIKEVKYLYPLSGLFSDPQKLLIATFIAELLGKTLQEGVYHSNLFVFLKWSMIELDSSKENLAYFHLVFLIEFADYLGFKPSTSFEITHCQANVGNTQVTDEVINLFELLIEQSYKIVGSFSLLARRASLDLLINFYHQHLDYMTEIKSTRILREIAV